MLSQLAISTAAGILAGSILFYWRDFPIHHAGVIGMMASFFVYHLMQAIARLRQLYRKEPW